MTRRALDEALRRRYETGPAQYLLMTRQTPEGEYLAARDTEDPTQVALVGHPSDFADMIDNGP